MAEGVTTEEWEVIRAWLTCVECVEGEYEAVMAIGPDAIQMLTSTLAALPEDRKENLRRQFSAAFERNQARAAMAQDEYVTEMIENVEALWQMRSADALAGLAGGREEVWNIIRESLDDAAGRGYREDVIENSENLLFFSAIAPPLASDGTVTGRVLTWWDSLGIAGETVTLRRCTSPVGASTDAGPGSCGSLPGDSVRVTTSSGGFAFTSLLEGLYEAEPTSIGSGGGGSSVGVIPRTRLFRLVGAADSVSGDFVVRYLDGQVDVSVTVFGSEQVGVELGLSACNEPAAPMDPTGSPVEMACADSPPGPTGWATVTDAGGLAGFSAIPEGYYLLTLSNLPPGVTGPDTLMIAISGPADHELVSVDFH